MSPEPTSAAKVNHPWSVDALLAKAQRYADEMLRHPHDDWRFGLASTFVLEFVARAALAKVSPTLLADWKNSRDWDNVYFALGFTPKTSRFIPRSVGVAIVLQRIAAILPAFTEELEGFAIQHMNYRNEELHTGTTPFDGVRPNWLAPFYETCVILLKSLGEDLSLLVGPEESAAADDLIAASRDSSAKAVGRAIEEHQRRWAALEEAEKEKASRQASTWAIRQAGHRVRCPACGSDALLTGRPFTGPSLRLNGDQLIVETQEYLPAKFECIACRLKISGLSQLTVCDLGSPYKATTTYDAAEYYAPDDPYRGFDDDNNEN
ncbi:MAG: hypothetical protein L6R30_26325 [Thermoanaerobaculia bacterium]|nr:hypothetical protein [Thermoanaerobaculia bacterium]